MNGIGYQEAPASGDIEIVSEAGIVPIAAGKCLQAMQRNVVI